MAEGLALGTVSHWNCNPKQWGDGTGYLNCTRSKGAEPRFALPLHESRDQRCEDPNLAYSQALRNCKYVSSGGLTRCGCPTLDPIKNPELWNTYCSSAQQAISQRIQNGEKEITLTFFASGGLSGTLQLLEELFSKEPLASWNGTLHLQFVDTAYEMVNLDDDKRVSNTTKKVLAVVFGLLGSVAIYSGVKQKENKKRFALIGGGVICEAVALSLFCTSFETSRVAMKDPDVNQATRSFLSELSSRTPKTMTLTTRFFSSWSQCVKSQRQTDILLGYDISGGEQDFERLRMEGLHARGLSILAHKTPQIPTKSGFAERSYFQTGHKAGKHKRIVYKTHHFRSV